MENEHPTQGFTYHPPEPLVDVVMINMPFGPLLQPSIGLGYLKAGLTAQDISSKILYFTLRFAQLISVDSYQKVSNGESATYDLVGEWIFAGTLFDSETLDEEGYIQDVLYRRAPGCKNARPLSEAYIQDMLRIRGEVAGFLDQCVHEVAKYHPKVIGFTSIFQQHVASLALAKRIKAIMPETVIVFGGANCEGVMAAEIIRQFTFVDAVVSGEGDFIFSDLVQRVLAHRSISDLQGVYTQANADLSGVNGVYTNTPSVRQMDMLPIPDYDDFFEQLAASNIEGAEQARLMFETSRGCWWGEKNHCTFCGLNGVTMSFRSKSATRALEELTFLTSKYPGYPISVVDNILDIKYFKDFVPELATRQLDVELFYEVKANLRKEQVRLLSAAGITKIQPGIESLSSQVLTIMHKGIKGLQNIQLLKWCKELGVHPYWNVLWGFPGEQPEEYARMATLIPLLTHLVPPGSSATIRLDRFSPNFDQAERYGFTNIQPYPVYRYIYPLNPQTVANLAYYFTFDYQQERDVSSYTKPVAQAITTWRQVYASSDLFSVDKQKSLLIWDLRPVAQEPLTVLDGLLRVIYLACDGIQSMVQIGKMIEEQTGAAPSVLEIESLLQPLLERGLMIRDDNSYLSLALPLGEYSPSRSVLERFQQLLETFATSSGTRVVVPVPVAAGKEVLLEA